MLLYYYKWCHPTLRSALKLIDLIRKRKETTEQLANLTHQAVDYTAWQSIMTFSLNTRASWKGLKISPTFSWVRGLNRRTVLSCQRDCSMLVSMISFTYLLYIHLSSPLPPFFSHPSINLPHSPLFFSTGFSAQGLPLWGNLLSSLERIEAVDWTTSICISCIQDKARV